jgi:pimeloyl-ACP methyl ester carboxylesterase
MTKMTARRPFRRLAIAALTTTLLLASLLPASASAAPAAAAPVSPTRAATSGYLSATERDCPGSEFRCVTLVVPKDHFAATDPGTFEVTYAIHRATKSRVGVWVTATGGPGTSGIAVADWYMSGMDPRIVESYDIVFYDQRGTGVSAPLACPSAAARFYLSPADARDPSQQTAAIAVAARFSRDCVRESGVDVADLPYFSTRQSVEDLEAFREWLGVAALDLYGESYGTQYVQTYALAHPGNVRSLILDGAVDLSLSAAEYYAEGYRAFDSVLEKTLAACTADRECRRDVVGGDALAAYDRLTGDLSVVAKRVPFHLGSGRTTGRTFAATNLETVALNQVYGQWGRMELQRAVAAFSRGNLDPSLRLLYSDVGVSPETLRPTPDPSWSDAAYYAIECTDYAYFAGTPEERAMAYIAAGEAAGADSARLGRVFYDDLPCASWPARAPTDERPAPITAPTYQMLVLASDVDPATAYGNALRIVERAPDARLLTQRNGPHVLYGRGVACVDDVVTALLVDVTLPARRSVCDGDLTEPYLPLAAARVAAARDPLAVATAVDDWISTLPAYEYWDGASAGVRSGCDHGGTFGFTARGVDVDLRMTRCALAPGLPMAMTGRISESGAVRMEITTSLGTLRYTRSVSGDRRVIGTWRGVRVDRRG